MGDIGSSLLLLKGLLQPLRSMGVALPRERRRKSLLSLPPNLGSERIRILHEYEYSWRGAEDSNLFATTTVTYQDTSVCVV
jgi:hypothetical protein